MHGARLVTLLEEGATTISLRLGQRAQTSGKTGFLEW